MKPSLQKLYNYFKLEISRGYDNNAVVGGLDRMLDNWEAEARVDSLDEELIQLVNSRVRDYPRLSINSRAELLTGLWRRIQRDEQVPDIIFTQPDDEKEAKPEILEISSTKQAEELISEKKVIDSESQEEEHLIVEQENSEEDSIDARQIASDAVPTEPVALDASVTVLPGIGASRASTLNRLGIYSLRDMLYYFPRRYDDYSLLKPINRLSYGDETTVLGTVENVGIRNIRDGRMKIIEAVISDGSGVLRITWFNQVWIARRLRKGAQIAVSGKVDQYLGRLTMNNPEWEYLDQQQLSTNRIVPVYPLTANLTQRRLRNMMNQVINYWTKRIPDPIPSKIRQSANLVDLSNALVQIHFPETWEELEAARHRLAFDEIFFLQLGVQRQKREWQQRSARIFSVDDQWLNNQLARLPYKLTQAQQRAIMDLRGDLVSGHPMNRLIQGDVGSGKTVVAALTIGMVAKGGAQSAIMAPTSLLAEQHYASLKELLSGEFPVIQESEIRLLVGSTPASEREDIHKGLIDGRIKLLIGTHALIEDPVVFADLQLVILDEQHRFGVRQRAALRSKGDNPHLMVMTATPIPRSLTLTIYGDLDLSIIDELPPGRKPVSTYLLAPRELERAYSFIQNEVEKGRQAFIVYPLVEESESSQSKAAVDEYSFLQEDVFKELSVGLIHGRMRPEEKEETMARFRDGEYQVLVSTTVIEVGVDVPNASVMLIEGANRFGLAQLHQLRGRVGRSAEKSYCILVPDSIDDIENERLLVMSETNDGFVLAERDLEQRGPGEFLGTRQSGFGELRVAQLTDVHLIDKARRFAQALFEEDPDLSQPQNRLLVATLKESWAGGEGDIS